MSCVDVDSPVLSSFVHIFGLLIRWSQVRILHDPPKTSRNAEKPATFKVAGFFHSSVGGSFALDAISHQWQEVEDPEAPFF